jgi:hypothetical protein
VNESVNPNSIKGTGNVKEKGSSGFFINFSLDEVFRNSINLVGGREGFSKAELEGNNNVVTVKMLINFFKDKFFSNFTKTAEQTNRSVAFGRTGVFSRFRKWNNNGFFPGGGKIIKIKNGINEDVNFE